MPAQIPINRVSTKTSLEDRYLTQKVGGSFDVKSELGIRGHRPIIDTLQSKMWTPAGFKVSMKDTEFKPATLNFVDTTGFSNKKYKP